MRKIQLHKIKVSLSFILFFALFVQCESKKNTNNDASFQSIENYFAKKNWNFPINIVDTTLQLKYYRDTSNLKIIPNQFSNDIEKLRSFFSNKQYLISVTKKALLDTTKALSSGYYFSKPIIFIDTTDYGGSTAPKIFLAFSSAKYRINVNSTSHGLPCEDCVLEEGNKIIKYPSAIFFELNKTKDSLLFSRFD